MTRRSTGSNTLSGTVGVNMILKHAKSIKLNLIPEEDIKKVRLHAIWLLWQTISNRYSRGLRIVNLSFPLGSFRKSR